MSYPEMITNPNLRYLNSAETNDFTNVGGIPRVVIVQQYLGVEGNMTKASSRVAGDCCQPQAP